MRLARPSLEEAEAFASLHVACWRETYGGLVPDAVIGKATAETRIPIWRAALADPTRVVIGAYDGGPPVGFVMAGAADEPPADGHIHALYIRSSHHRRGLGRTLIGATARVWMAQGGQSLSVGVLATNSPARSFYEALGGRLIRTGHHDWGGHNLAEATYLFEHLEELGTIT